MSPIEQFREFLGEPRFLRFVGQIRDLSRGPRLCFWRYFRHYPVLAEFERATGIALPRSPTALSALLDELVPAPPRLARKQVPEWITIDGIDGYSPLRAEGVCHLEPTRAPWRFYFHARHESWSIGACDDQSDPVIVEENSDHTFYHRELYECRTDNTGAGGMPIETARYYIVRELSRLRTERVFATP